MSGTSVLVWVCMDLHEECSVCRRSLVRRRSERVRSTGCSAIESIERGGQTDIDAGISGTIEFQAHSSARISRLEFECAFVTRVYLA